MGLQEAARKAAKAAENEARRKAAQEAAAQQQEEYLKKLEEKLGKSKPRLVSTGLGLPCNGLCGFGSSYSPPGIITALP